MHLPDNSTDKDLEEAARWLHLMQQEPSAAERAAFDYWLMESRRHIRDYILMAALDQNLRQVDPEKRLPLSLDAGADAQVVPLRPALLSRPTLVPHASGLAPPIPARSTRWLWATAAGVGSMLLATVLVVWALGADRYTTTIGEQRVVRLSDGSQLYLNTGSSAEVRFTAQLREIRLLSGEALFTVAKDSTRPFRVIAGPTSIQAIGTQFNVYRHDAETAVSVVEGSVRVVAAPQIFAARPAPVDPQSLPLKAGEEAHVGKDGTVHKVSGADVSSAVAWRERRLVFRDQSLGAIVREFNRYNDQPHFRVEGEAPNAHRYSGIFDAYDPQSLLQILSADGDLQVERAGTEIVVRAK